METYWKVLRELWRSPKVSGSKTLAADAWKPQCFLPHTLQLDRGLSSSNRWPRRPGITSHTHGFKPTCLSHMQHSEVTTTCNLCQAPTCIFNDITVKLWVVIVCFNVKHDSSAQNHRQMGWFWSQQLLFLFIIPPFLSSPSLLHPVSFPCSYLFQLRWDNYRERTRWVGGGCCWETVAV